MGYGGNHLDVSSTYIPLLIFQPLGIALETGMNNSSNYTFPIAMFSKFPLIYSTSIWTKNNLI